MKAWLCLWKREKVTIKNKKETKKMNYKVRFYNEQADKIELLNEDTGKMITFNAVSAMVNYCHEKGIEILTENIETL